MFIFQVHHYIKPDQVEVYKTATLENARETIKEPGILRFDVFQDQADPTHFSLFEVYRDMEARQAHLDTAHFLKWKEVALAAFAKRGHGDKFLALFPSEDEWRKPAG